MLLQEKLTADQSVVELSDLHPSTDYSVTLYALYEEEPSDPVTAVASTRKSPEPAHACVSLGLGSGLGS